MRVLALFLAASLCLCLVLASKRCPGGKLTGSWTAVVDGEGPVAGSGNNIRRLHSVPYQDLTNEEFYILVDPKNESKLIFQAVTDQGTGWSSEDGKWDDYTSNPGSGAWGTGFGTLADDGSVQAILDPGVTDPKSTQDKPGGRYEIRVTGKLDEDCDTIVWDNSTGTIPSGFDLGWTKQIDIKKVHLVFMNHLDAGYAIHLYEGNPYGFISNVLNTYQREYIPRAIGLQKTLRAMGREERFIYTTQPWLVSLYLDCPPNFIMANGSKLYCPTDEEKQDFEDAVHLGDITWHHGPFNLEPENCMTEFLFEAGLNISLNLDKRFKLKPKTLTFSQRDVPSMTRGVVPLLRKYNFDAISVGQNGDTPPLFFGARRWVDKESNTDIIWMNHPYGYPSSPGPTGKHCNGLCRKECTMVAGFDEALCFGFRSDNAGPPTSIEMVLHWFEIAEEQFPGAVVESSTFSDFVEALLPYKSQLPVVSSEAGDAWIQGIASDPYKMSYNRALGRVLESCYLDGRCDPNDPIIQNSTRLLIKVPEHTWGLPNIHASGINKDDNVNWDNKAFENARKNGDYRSGYTDCQEGWREQRLFNDYALEALRDHPVYAEAKKAVEDVRVPASFPGALNEYEKIGPTDQKFDCGNGTVDTIIAFDPEKGGLKYLKMGKTEWVSGQSPFLSLVYRTYNETDFQEMHKACASANRGKPCGYGGYDKPGSECKTFRQGCPQQATYYPSVKSFYKKLGAGQCSFVSEMAMPPTAWEFYGSAKTVWTNVTVVDFSSLSVEIVFLEKTSSRLAESMMVEFYPDVQSSTMSWWMNKLGSWISPSEVNQEFLGGNVWQHAINRGIVYGETASEGTRLGLFSADAPVAAPITKEQEPTPFIKSVQPLKQGDLIGFAYNLWNNIWNTNYIFYYPYLEGVHDENLKYRFEIKSL